MVAKNLQGRYAAYVILVCLSFLLIMSLARPAIAALLPTILISSDANGGAGNSGSIGGVPIGSNAVIAFQSDASNLVSGDTNNATDMFIKNLASGAVTRISTDSSGAQGNSDIYNYPASSDDGRYVVFDSEASNLVAGDTNNARDVFLKDLQTNATTRVSTDSSGAQASAGGIGSPVISANGRYVLFDSSASNLVAGDTNNARDVFLKDLQTNATTRVSTDSSGAQGNGGTSGWPIMSSDARYIVFRSAASNLVAGDTNGAVDVFLKDLQTNATTRVSTDSSGAQASAGGTGFLGVSNDGRYIAFISASTNLVTGDTNGVYDVFLKDRQTNVTTRVSTTSDGLQLNAASGVGGPVLSPDGKYVIFDSSATNVTSDPDTNGVSDLFIKNMSTGEVVKLSLGVSDTQSDAGMPYPSVISPDSRYIFFSTAASNFVAGDTNSAEDVFMRQNPFWVDSNTQSDSSSGSSATATAPRTPNTGQALVNTWYPKVVMGAGFIMVGIGAVSLYRLRNKATLRK